MRKTFCQFYLFKSKKNEKKYDITDILISFVNQLQPSLFDEFFC